MAKHVSRDIKPVPLEVVDLREKYFAGSNGMTIEATPNIITNLVEVWIDPAHHRGDTAASAAPLLTELAAIANLRLTREAAQDLAEQLMQAADRLMPR